MNRNYEDWLKYYENATKEQVIEDMMLDINSIKEKDKEIEKLNKEKSILEKSLKLIWQKDIKINYEELDKANKDIEKELKGSDKDEFQENVNR